MYYKYDIISYNTHSKSRGFSEFSTRVRLNVLGNLNRSVTAVFVSGGGDYKYTRAKKKTTVLVKQNQPERITA